MLRYNNFLNEKSTFNNSKIPFLLKLKESIEKTILPDISPEFKLYYKEGHEIVIKTDNDKNLKLGIKIEDNNLSYYAYPINKPSYEYTFNFNPFDFTTILKMIKDEFNDNPNGGIIELNKSVNIKKEPTYDKNMISVETITDVLENAFILDDIDIKNVTIEQLIKRMKFQEKKLGKLK